MKMIPVLLCGGACFIAAANYHLWHRNKGLEAEAEALRELGAIRAGEADLKERSAEQGDEGNGSIFSAFDAVFETPAGGAQLSDWVEGSGLDERQIVALVERVDGSGTGDEATSAAAYESLLLELAELNPGRAVELAVERGAGGAALFALARWGELSPDEALVWFREAERRGVWDTDERFNPLRDARGALLVGIARSDVERALAVLQSGGAGMAQRYLGVVAAGLSSERLPTLGRQLSTVEDPEFLRAAATTAAAALGVTGRAEDAVAFLDAFGEGEPSLAGDLATVVVQNLPFESLDSPGVVGDFLVGRDDGGDSNRQGVAWFVSRWAQSDYEGAARWLSSLPPSRPLRDVAVAEFVRQVTKADPESGADWAASIGDDELRSRVLGSVFQAWSESDTPSASAYFEKMGWTVPAAPNRDP